LVQVRLQPAARGRDGARYSITIHTGEKAQIPNQKRGLFGPWGRRLSAQWCEGGKGKKRAARGEGRGVI